MRHHPEYPDKGASHHEPVAGQNGCTRPVRRRVVSAPAAAGGCHTRFGGGCCGRFFRICFQWDAAPIHQLWMACGSLALRALRIFPAIVCAGALADQIPVCGAFVSRAAGCALAGNFPAYLRCFAACVRRRLARRAAQPGRGRAAEGKHPPARRLDRAVPQARKPRGTTDRIAGL